MTSDMNSRDDLPFANRDSEGHLHDWHPLRGESRRSHAAGVQRGIAFFKALARLANANDIEAYSAVKFSLLSPHWDRHHAEEQGFADALARTVLVGLRAQRAGKVLKVNAPFLPTPAQWLALHARMDLLEAQLAAMTPAA